MFVLLKKIDWYLTGAVIVIAFMSLVSLASVSSQDVHPYGFFWRQVLWFLIGLALFFFFIFFDSRVFAQSPVLAAAFYIFSFLFLVATIFLGSVIRGTRGWIAFGSFNFQPVELMQVALIIILAKYFLMRHVEILRLRHFFISGFYAFVPAIIVFLQPDLGSVIILTLIWLGIIFSAGVSWRHFLTLFLIFAVLGVGAWFVILKPYHKARLLTLFDPGRDPLGVGYNITQAKIAIGSAGFWGKGFGHGTQARLGFLPEARTDFLFAAFFEEWGFAAALVLFGLFGFIFYRLYRIMARSNSNFLRLFVVGMLVLIQAEFIINIGMNLGLMPVIGIPLPFFSYGGSSMVMLLVGLGILQGLYARDRGSIFKIWH